MGTDFKNWSVIIGLDILCTINLCCVLQPCSHPCNQPIESVWSHGCDICRCPSSSSRLPVSDREEDGVCKRTACCKLGVSMGCFQERLMLRVALTCICVGQVYPGSALCGVAFVVLAERQFQEKTAGKCTEGCSCRRSSRHHFHQKYKIVTPRVRI